MQAIDLLLRVSGAVGGGFVPLLEFRPVLVLLSSLVQEVAGNAVALHSLAKGLTRCALRADVLAPILLEPRQRLDRGRLAAGGRRGELELLPERGLLFAGFAACFLLAETKDVSLSDQDRGGQDLSIQTQKPGAVRAAVVEDVVCNGSSRGGLLCRSFRFSEVVVELDLGAVFEGDEGAGAPRPAVPRLKALSQGDLLSGASRAAPAAAQSGESGLQPAVLDLEDHGAAVAGAEREGFEGSEAGPGLEVGWCVRVSHHRVGDAGGPDLRAVEGSVALRLPVERSAAFLAVEHGDVQPAAGNVKAAVEEPRCIARHDVCRAPQRHSVSEGLGRQCRLLEDVHVAGPRVAQVGAFQVGAVVIPWGDVDRYPGVLERLLQEVDRARRDAVALVQVAGDQNGIDAAFLCWADGVGHCLPQVQPLPAGDFRRCPAELGVQVDIAEGEQLHEAGFVVAGRRFASRGARRFRFAGAGRVGTGWGVCGAMGRERFRVMGGFWAVIATLRVPSASSRRHSRCSRRGPRATAP